MTLRQAIEHNLIDLLAIAAETFEAMEHHMRNGVEDKFCDTKEMQTWIRGYYQGRKSAAQVTAACLIAALRNNQHEQHSGQQSS
jgi:hypothetical protein